MADFKALLLEKEEAFEKIKQIMKENTEKYQAEMLEFEQEQFRLQGEYRLLLSLSKEAEEVKAEEVKAEDTTE